MGLLVPFRLHPPSLSVLSARPPRFIYRPPRFCHPCGELNVVQAVFASSPATGLLSDACPPLSPEEEQTVMEALRRGPVQQYVDAQQKKRVAPSEVGLY